MERTAKGKAIPVARCLFCSILTFAGLLVSSPGWPKSPEEIFTFVAPSIVVVETLDAAGQSIATGSGVVISLGEVVTNCHVVKNGQTLIVMQGKISYAAKIHHADNDRDLCQLTVTGLEAPPALLGSVTELKPGARVVAIGAPRRLDLSISEGLVSSLRAQADGSMLIQTTAPISPGSSGGGLFNDEGLLVGITTMYLDESQNLNFAIPANWILELPNRSYEKYLENSLSNQSPDKQKAMEELAKLGESLRAADPDFSYKSKYFQAILESFISSNIPVVEWPAAFEKSYWSLPNATTTGLLEKAHALTQSKDWEGLLAHTRSWTVSEPENKLAWYSLGWAHQELGSQFNDSASVYYQRALDTYEENAKEMLYNLGEAETSRFQLENARACSAFIKAVGLDSKFTEAWFLLGISSLQLDDQNTAVTAYQALQNLNPEMAEKLLSAFRR